jgi:hypothetical protein
MAIKALFWIVPEKIASSSRDTYAPAGKKIAFRKFCT